MNDAKKEPAQEAIFSINKPVGTKVENSYTENDINSWLNNAGFSDRCFFPGLNIILYSGIR
jgi:hypothetical protein